MTQGAQEKADEDEWQQGEGAIVVEVGLRPIDSVESEGMRVDQEGVAHERDLRGGPKEEIEVAGRSREKTDGKPQGGISQAQDRQREQQEAANEARHPNSLGE
jgi:hypothetical protein